MGVVIVVIVVAFRDGSELRLEFVRERGAPIEAGRDLVIDRTHVTVGARIDAARRFAVLDVARRFEQAAGAAR